MAYLFGAYLFLWATTFVYLFYLGSQQKRLQRELEGLLEERQTPASTRDSSLP